MHRGSNPKLLQTTSKYMYSVEFEVAEKYCLVTFICSFILLSSTLNKTLTGSYFVEPFFLISYDSRCSNIPYHIFLIRFRLNLLGNEGLIGWVL